MSDKKIILETLEFLKTEGDRSNDGVNIKEYFQKFDELGESDNERIRDRLVINGYASFPTQGNQWKLAITWHPNGGVDLLQKPKWVINKYGNLRNIYKGWKLLVKHSVTISISVVVGLLLFFIIDVYLKPKLIFNNQDKQLNVIDSTVNETNKNSALEIDTTLIDSLVIPVNQ